MDLNKYKIVEEGLFNRLSRDDIKYNKINQIIKEKYPDLWQKEQSDRRKAIGNIIKTLKNLSQKHNGKLVAGIKFMVPAVLPPDDPDYWDVTGWDGFLNEPVPTNPPTRSNIEYMGIPDWEITFLDYDVWEWADHHPECTNVRDEILSGEFPDGIAAALRIAETAFKSNRYFYYISCGGDWDGGGYEIVLKPSDRILKLAYSLGYSKLPTPTK